MPIDVFSFFSGLGFLDLGFENAGFNIAFVNEYNETFLRAYQYARRHRDFIPEFGYSHDDVRAFLSDEKWEDTFPQYDHRGDRLIGFIGGPPCPDFSAAGTNAGEKGLNGQLTIEEAGICPEYAVRIQRLRPRCANGYSITDIATGKTLKGCQENRIFFLAHIIRWCLYTGAFGIATPVV